MLGVREILSKSDVMPLGESTNEALVVKHTVQKKSMGPEWILPTVLYTQSVCLFNRAIRFLGGSSNLNGFFAHNITLF